MKFLPLELYYLRVYVGFWKRLGAAVIDLLVYVPLIVLYLYSFTTSATFYIICLVISSLFFPIYTVLFHYKYGATFGKLAVGIRVTQPDGSKINLRQAIMRSIVEILFEAIFLGVSLYAVFSMDLAYFTSLPNDLLIRVRYEASFLPSWYQSLDMLDNIWYFSEVVVLLFNERKRSFHDFIAGTVVIYKEFTKESLQSYGKNSKLVWRP